MGKIEYNSGDIVEVAEPIKDSIYCTFVIYQFIDTLKDNEEFIVLRPLDSEDSKKLVVRNKNQVKKVIITLKQLITLVDRKSWPKFIMLQASQNRRRKRILESIKLFLS